jgi:hypothetical protein
LPKRFTIVGAGSGVQAGAPPKPVVPEEAPPVLEDTVELAGAPLVMAEVLVVPLPHAARSTANTQYDAVSCIILITLVVGH